MSRYLPDIRLVPLILGFILVGLALPRAIVERSFLRFLQGLAVTLFGVMLPLIVFLLSAFLVPEWKGGCRLGWVDCFHLGKLALLPLVLWATAALYTAEMLPVLCRSAAWVVSGLGTGCIVAGGCLAYGVVSVVLRKDAGGMAFFLAVPLYIAVWHGVRAFQMGRHVPLRAGVQGLTFLGSLPLWIAGLFWSRRIYESLPNQAPSCFVVTAATHGHESLVGPFTEVRRNGRVLRANRQLLTLWQFEALWEAHSPRSHRAFRRTYNVLGPAVARRIALPWLADLAYICLKPVELFAAAVLCAVRGNFESNRRNGTENL